MPTIIQFRNWFKNSKLIKNQIADLNKKSIVLDKQIAALKVKQDYVEKISFFHKGIPINSYDGYHFSLILPINGEMRVANIYANAQKKNRYGANVRAYTPGRGRFSTNEIWLGAGYPRRNVLKQIVLDFLVDGTLPVEEDRKYW